MNFKFDNFIKINILSSGSNGNSIIIEFKDNNVIIDLGLSKREFFKRSKILDINFEKNNIVLITHFHSDHIKGLINIIGELNSINFISNFNSIEKIFSENKKNNKSIDFNSFLNKNKFFTFYFEKKNFIKNINGFFFYPVKTFHDDIDPSAFLISIKNNKIFYLTDTGKVDQKMYKLAQNSDIIFIEANYDDELLIKCSYPYHLKKRISSEIGHLSNNQAINFIIEIINIFFENKDKFSSYKTINSNNEIKNIYNDKMKIEKYFFFCHLSKNSNNPKHLFNLIIKVLHDNFYNKYNYNIYEYENSFTNKIEENKGFDKEIIIEIENFYFNIKIIERNKTYSYLFSNNTHNIAEIKSLNKNIHK